MDVTRSHCAKIQVLAVLYSLLEALGYQRNCLE